MLQLERINYDCHHYIRELCAEISGLRDEVVESTTWDYENYASSMGNDGKSMEGLRKGFLLDRNITNRRKDKMNDGRKKLYDNTEISGSYDNTI